MRRIDKITTSMWRVHRGFGSLKLLKPKGPLLACNGTASVHCPR